MSTTRIQGLEEEENERKRILEKIASDDFLVHGSLERVESRTEGQQDLIESLMRSVEILTEVAEAPLQTPDDPNEFIDCYED